LWIGHRFDAEPDTDPTFHFYAVQIQIGSYPQFYTCWKTGKTSATFSVKIFNIVNRVLKFSRKQLSLALHLVETDTDLDRQALDADPDPP
jgi:hypothetical protein